MAESFAFSEGALSVWTGVAPAVEIALVRNTNVSLSRGIINQQSINGNYFNTVTGQRADVSMNIAFTPDITLFQLFNQASGVHIHIAHSHAMGSAGLYLYSGAFDFYGVNGNEANIFTSPLLYHANEWSAYGE